MRTLTISISDEIGRKLKEIVRERYGSSKGAISKVIEEALKNYFAMLERKPTYFRAYKNGELIAEAQNLDELAEILRQKKIDPRSVRIISSEQIKPVVRRGWR